MPPRNRFVSALKEDFNLVSLASAVALSLATGNPAPLVVGLVAEAAYLIFVPDTRWYDRRLARKYDAEVEQRRQTLKEQTLPLLRPAMQDRFARLEQIRRQIDAVRFDGPEGRGAGDWFKEVRRKLDYLLEKFLLFASKEVQFRSYLRSIVEEMRGVPAARPGPRTKSRRGPLPLDDLPVDTGDRWIVQTVAEIEASYEGELEGIRAVREAEGDLNTQAVLDKRLEVLQRRREYVGKIGKILTNLNHQLQLLEDTFGLINDEIRARSPEQVLSDIEDVVWQTNSMTQLLEEMAPFEQIVARLDA